MNRKGKGGGNQGKPETRGTKRTKHFCEDCNKMIFSTGTTWKLHIERHRQALPAPEDG